MSTTTRRPQLKYLTAPSALSPSQIRFYKAMAERYGLTHLARRVGLTPPTLANLLAGLEVLRGSVAQARIATFSLSQQLETDGETELLTLAKLAMRDIEWLPLVKA
jgi:hypothetical protein